MVVGGGRAQDTQITRVCIHARTHVMGVCMYAHTWEHLGSLDISSSAERSSGRGKRNGEHRKGASGEDEDKAMQCGAVPVHGRAKQCYKRGIEWIEIGCVEWKRDVFEDDIDNC